LKNVPHEDNSPPNGMNVDDYPRMAIRRRIPSSISLLTKSPFGMMPPEENFSSYTMNFEGFPHMAAQVCQHGQEISQCNACNKSSAHEIDNSHFEPQSFKGNMIRPTHSKMVKSPFGLMPPEDNYFPTNEMYFDTYPRLTDQVCQHGRQSSQCIDCNCLSKTNHDGFLYQSPRCINGLGDPALNVNLPKSPFGLMPPEDTPLPNGIYPTMESQICQYGRQGFDCNCNECITALAYKFGHVGFECNKSGQVGVQERAFLSGDANASPSLFGLMPPEDTSLPHGISNAPYSTMVAHSTSNRSSAPIQDTGKESVDISLKESSKSPFNVLPPKVDSVSNGLHKIQPSLLALMSTESNFKEQKSQFDPKVDLRDDALQLSNKLSDSHTKLECSICLEEFQGTSSNDSSLCKPCWMRWVNEPSHMSVTGTSSETPVPVASS